MQGGLLLLMWMSHMWLANADRLVLTLSQAVDSVPNLAAFNLRMTDSVLVKQYGRRQVWATELTPEAIYLAWNDTIPSGIDLVDVEKDSQVALRQAVFPQGVSLSIPEPTEWNFLDSERYSLQMEKVWAGLASGWLVGQRVPVAVVDSGVAFLVNTYFESVVPGYDFISDTSLSLDGDGRDADASDPGDGTPFCPGSTWHGTKMASALCLLNDTVPGVHSMLPVRAVALQSIRVLGACGKGYASDVADAIVWSSGGRINGILNNSNPARVISMSFSGPGACPSYLQSAVTQAVESGCVLLAAAGNQGSDASGYFPGNCKGVVVVGASTRAGDIAPYSNTDVTLLAPGGDAKDSINTVTVMNGALEAAYGAGTSFSAAFAAGLAALSLFLRPNATAELPLTQFPENSSCALSNGCGGGLGNGLMLLQGYVRSDTKVVQLDIPPDTNVVQLDRPPLLTGQQPAFNGSIVQSATTYGSMAACLAMCAGDCLGSVCTCIYTDRSYTMAYSRCSSCGAGNYMLNDTSPCQQCGVGTYSGAGSWYPQQLVLNGDPTVYNYIGVFSDGFPGYCNGACIWWWVFTWIYGDQFGSNRYWWTGGGPGGYWQGGEYIAIQGLKTLTQNVIYCANCTAGTFASSPGQSACTSCPVGTFSTGIGAVSASTCTPCPGGMYSSVMGSAACLSCGAGTFAPPGSTACQICPVSAYSVTAGASCTACPTGKLTGGTGSQALSSCNLYNNMSACSQLCNLDCPGSVCTCIFADRSYSLVYSRCSSCGAGNYMLNDTSPCQQCGNGTYSGAGSWYPQQLVLNGDPTVYNYIGVFSDGFPGYCNGACIWWWVFTWIYGDQFGSNRYWWTGGGPGGYWQGGEYIAIQGLKTLTQNVIYCANCTAGTFASSPGQSACLQCGVGTFTANATQTTCTKCAIGLYQNSTGASVCLACPIGTTNAQTGLSACSLCTNVGSGSCSGCYQGYYASGGVCLPCSAGKYTSNYSQNTCLSCPVTTYQDQTGASYCKQCIASMYSNSPGTCVNCSAGQYSTIGSIVCSLCEVGTYAPSAMSQCMTCVPGTYQNAKGSSNCTPCPVGTYTGLFGATACVACYPTTMAGAALCPTAPVVSKLDTRAGFPCWLGPDGVNGAYTNSALVPLYGSMQQSLGTVTVSTGTTVVGGQTIPRGVQIWSPVVSGTYTFVAAGAAGGGNGCGGSCTSNNAQPGRGVVVTTTYNLVVGQTVCIVVGQQPGNGSTMGGGGTFISIFDPTLGAFSLPAAHTLLLVAGGGGGAGMFWSGSAYGLNATLQTSGVNYQSGTSKVAIRGGGGGACSFDGGNGTDGVSTNLGSDYSGGSCGGGGFLGNGGSNLLNGAGGTSSMYGGYSFVNGSQGGYVASWNSGAGFGGGGSAWNGGGGGGGYSGGNAGDQNNRNGGGGGGSYDINGPGNNSTLYSFWNSTMFGSQPVNFSAGYSVGDGFAVISACAPGTFFVSGQLCSVCPPGSYQNLIGASACVQCPAGMYSATSGASICVACPVGTYQAAVGGSTCSPCQVCGVGYFSSCGGAVQGGCPQCTNQ